MFHFLWRGGGRPAWPSCSSQWASSWAGPSVLAGSRLETRLLTLPILPGKIRVSYFYSAGLEGLEGTLALEVTMETKHLQYTVPLPNCENLPHPSLVFMFSPSYYIYCLTTQILDIATKTSRPFLRWQTVKN